MAKKVILKDLKGTEVLPITRGELVIDSSGKQALHSNEFLATTSLPGLMSATDKNKLDNFQGDTYELSGVISDDKYITTLTSSKGVTTNAVIEPMQGATVDLVGKVGLVPAPLAGYQNKFLSGDGTWKSPAEASITAEDILEKLKTVDGAGSGLDADAVDGFHMRQWFTNASDITNTAMFWQASGSCSDVSSMSYAALINVFGDTGRRWQIWNSRDDHLLYWRPEKSDMSDWADVHVLLDNYNFKDYVTNMYWANVPVSSTSNDKTTPTFADTIINGIVTVNGPQCAITVNSSCKGAYADFMRMLNPNMSSTYHTAHLAFGYALSAYNLGYIGFKFVEKDSKSNMVTIGLHSADHILNVLANGKVGIGTTAPEFKLHTVGKIVSKSTQNSVRLIPDEDCGLYMTSSGQWIHIAGSGSTMYMYNGTWDNKGTDNYNKGIIISTTNNIGIGISPSRKLDVQGNAKVCGTLHVGEGLPERPTTSTLGKALLCIGNFVDTNRTTFSYGTAFWTEGNGYGFILQGRGDGTASTYKLILNPLGGNVGIGDSDPAYKLEVAGSICGTVIYANRDGSTTAGGVSLYSNSDPMTYGIAFRGTGTYGTHGYVTAANDWATYLTMSDTLTRGWIFRRGSTNVASIAGSGNMAINENLEFSNGAHIATNRTTDYHYSSLSFSIGNNSKNIGMYSGPEGEAGGVVVSPDGCLIYNSSDSGFNLDVHDKDLGGNLTAETTRTFAILQSGYYAWSRGGFQKSGSSDSYVLLGGGDHKLESNLSVSYAASANYANSAGTATSLGSGALTYMCSCYATNTHSAYKIVTNWNKSLNIMPTINIRGYDYLNALTVDCDIVMYHYSNAPCNYSLTNKGSYAIRVWQAIESDVQVFYISPGTYYGMFNVFVYGGMGTGNFTGWYMTSASAVSGTEIGKKPIATSITGNSATASSVDWSGITNKPSTFTPSTHYHNYFPENTAVYFRDPNNASWRGGMYWGSAGNEALCFAVVNANTSFRFFTGSDLANWTSSTWQGTPAFEVNKNGAYAPHFYENSDAKLKENIQTILDRDNIPQIKEFDWKESGEHSYGLIAQELEEQGYSELVSTKDDGYKTVNYSAALSLIVGKLQVKIKELEKEIEILKSK